MLVALAASLAALAVGPLLVGIAKNRSVLEAADGFVVIALLGLAFFHVLPEAFADGGAWALLAAACGAFAPAMLERRVHDERAADRVGGTFALLAFAVHGIVDGLAIRSDVHGHALTLTVVLHRVPEGIAAWTLLRPAWGRRKTVAALAALGCVTVFGAALGTVGAFAAPRALAIVQAAAIGSVLHVVLHHAPRTTGWKHHHDHATDSSRDLHASHEASRLDGSPRRGRLHLASLVGALAGLGAFVAMFHEGATTHEATTKSVFLHTAAASAPWLVLACLAAGFADAFSSRALRSIASGSIGVGAVVRAAVLAPLLPVCSCGVRPLFDLLADRKVRAPIALSVLVAAAGLGPATLLLSVGLLGPSFAGARVVGTLATAMIAGIGARMTRPPPAWNISPSRVPPVVGDDHVPRLRWRLRPVLETVDHATAWVLLGLVAAAVGAPFMDVLQQVPAGPLVIGCALAGLPAYFGAAGVTPLAAVLIERGTSPGAALAFVLTASAANLGTLRVVTARHGLLAGTWFASTIAGVAIAVGLAFDALAGAPRAESKTVSDSAQIVALASLLLIVVVAMVRHGPRHLLSQVVSRASREY